jgi:outer membrane lipoprotein-sorting protein
MKVMQHDDNALRKVSKDFGMIYKIKGDISVQYKEENQMRIEGSLGASRAVLIVSGAKQIVRIPGVGINTSDDLGASPGKRKTLLDVGLISEGYLGYTQAVYKGARPVAGTLCAVFEVSYRNKELDTSHRILWIDPKTKVVLKREEYSQTGKLNAIFFYKEPKEIASGVWFPSSIEVVNNQGQKAGTTAYSNVKVNQGLSDSVFK